MDPERVDRLGLLFEQALSLEPSERGNFVEIACADDAELRSELRSLLAAHDEAPDYLEQAVQRLHDARGDLVGHTFAQYRVVERLGGTVGCESEEGRGSTFWLTTPIERSRDG